MLIAVLNSLSSENMSPTKIYIRLTESDDYEEPMVSLELFLKISE